MFSCTSHIIFAIFSTPSGMVFSFFFLLYWFNAYRFYVTKEMPITSSHDSFLSKINLMLDVSKSLNQTCQHSNQQIRLLYLKILFDGICLVIWRMISLKLVVKCGQTMQQSSQIRILPKEDDFRENVWTREFMSKNLDWCTCFASFWAEATFGS